MKFLRVNPRIRLISDRLEYLSCLATLDYPLALISLVPSESSPFTGSFIGVPLILRPAGTFVGSSYRLRVPKNPRVVALGGVAF